MKSQTALVARQYRLQEWTAMIQACQARPETMTVAQWCEENSITTANYYYRLKEVRKSLLENISTEPSPDIVPVSMDLLTVAEEPRATSVNDDSTLELVSNGITIRVTDKTKPELLIKVLEVIRHAK